MTLPTSTTSGSRSNELIHQRYLANGCEVYLEQVDFAPLVTLQLWVKTGSIDETPTEFGMAHVLEHMLFKGTERHPRTGDVARLVEAAGGEINAYTTFDHTVFYINAPREFAFQGAELLFDVVCSSLLDQNELERELEVVIEEIRRSRDNPSARLSHSLFGKVFEGFPMGRPVIGFEEVVKTFNRENLSAFYKRWYVPNNMFFIAAGDFHIGEMSARLDSLAATFPPRGLPKRNWLRNHSWPLSDGPHCEVIHGPYQETRLQLATPAPCLEDDATPAWEMFASILGHGDSSRLSHNVKDEAQLVTAIDASLYTPRFPYGFAGIAFYGRSETAHAALHAATAEIARLAKEGPTHAELQRVLTSAKAEKIYGRESIEGLVRNIGSNLLTTARLEFDTIFLQKLTKISVAQVQECARMVCENIMTGKVVCLAASNQEHSDIISSESIRATIKSCAELVKNELHSQSQKDAQTLAFKTNVIPSQRNPSILHTQIDLGHSTRLHYNTRLAKRLPVASQILVWRWGQHEEPKDKIGVNAFLAQMLTRGTTRQSYRAFVTELEDLGASISAFSGRDLFGLRLDALSEVQPRALRMMIDCLVRPALESEQFERVMRETEEVLVAQKDSPGSRLGRLNGPLLYGDHVYSHPPLGTLETLKNISLDDIRTQWQRLLLVDSFVLSGAGDFSNEETLEAIAVELGGIAAQRTARSQALAALQTPQAAPNMPARMRIGFDPLEREQAHVSLSVRGYPLTDKRRTALEVACSVLGGQGGRLFMDLRDAQSLAYSVGCSQSPSLFGGSLNTYIGTAAAKTEQALLGLKSHLEKIATEPPTQEELDRAKNSLLGAQSLDSQHHHYQASQLAMSDIYGLGFDNFLGFRERVEAVTRESVSASVNDLLKSESPCVAIVGPEGTWVPDSNDTRLGEWNL